MTPVSDLLEATPPLEEGASVEHRARQAFLERVRAVPGILAVTDTGEGAIRVRVSDRRSPAGQSVYDLEDTVRAEYPQADLDVWVSEAP